MMEDIKQAPSNSRINNKWSFNLKECVRAAGHNDNIYHRVRNVIIGAPYKEEDRGYLGNALFACIREVIGKLKEFRLLTPERKRAIKDMIEE